MLHTREEITDWGQAHHHPWGPAATPGELLDNEQLWARGFFIQVEDQQNGSALVYPGAPYRLSRSPWRLRHPAPKIGEHNQEIFCGELGLSAGELERLSSEGTI